MRSEQWSGHGPILQFLSNDHRRLEELLEAATRDPVAVDRGAYAKFRAGLLQHISMEERILLPAIRRMRNGVPLFVEEQLRLDHGAIAALLVPPPIPQVIRALRAILFAHNILEEGRGGVYDQCDAISGRAADDLIEELSKAPVVPVSENVDNPKVLDATRRALARAGYDFEDYADGE